MSDSVIVLEDKEIFDIDFKPCDKSNAIYIGKTISCKIPYIDLNRVEQRYHTFNEYIEYVNNLQIIVNEINNLIKIYTNINFYIEMETSNGPIPWYEYKQEINFWLCDKNSAFSI